MNLIRTPALILRTIPFQETSVIVRLFTKEQGKVAVIAKGGRRLKSPFRGYLESLNYVDVIYYTKQTREIQLLSTIESIEFFFRNQPEIEQIAYASAIVECIDKSIRDQHKDETIFQLTVDSLRFISGNPALSREAFFAFLFKLTDALGYKMNLDECSICGKPLTRAGYDMKSGSLICQECRKYSSDVIPLDPEMMNFLKAVESVGLSDQLLRLANEKFADEIMNVLMSYLSFHLDYPLNLKSLDMIRTKR
ncbi:MAG: DNA repair protein RecO [Candidatus Marinimicrobia bacterium CG08_land_8_20_14_0_20_45_22]|nr:MAG: DNA repair protein RecO [Candidatus Marinimicrobia bacterium CG08_land_8_20_14_0_20_45_22]